MMSELPNTNPIPDLDAEGRQVLQSFRLSRIIVPVVLGLLAVGYLFYRQFDPERFREINWSTHAWSWIGVSFLLLIIRHLFYAFRLYTLGNGALSWRKCLELMVIWEFSTNLTPTSKGGPFIMLFVLSRERLNAGQTATSVFYTMLCDSGFFVLTLPVWLMIYGPPMLYPGMKSYSDVGLASGAFFVTYTMMASYWLILLVLLVLRPQYAHRVLRWLGQSRWLRRYKHNFERIGHEFTLAAREIRHQPWSYHLKVILSTVGVWTSKFIMINCIIIAIVPETPFDGSTQAFIYARLVAMFIIMAFSPTPGGAGLAELALAGFISDYVPTGIGLVVALIWRGMAYYGYLILGAIVVPNWVSKKFTQKKTV